MIQHAGHRRVQRPTVPPHLRGSGRGSKAVQLVELSLAGARLEQVEPLPDWGTFPSELPRALGGGRVRAEVVWSRFLGRRQVVEDKRWLAHQSGLAFTHSTPEVQAALTVALVRIAGDWALGMLREFLRQEEDDLAHQERFDALCSESLAWLRQEIMALRLDTSQ